jgi:ribonuclease HI
MELTAVIAALEAIDADARRRREEIELHTDSQYVQKGITLWISNWIRRGWVTTAKTPVKNRDLWQRLQTVTERLSVHWVWVKGHAGIELNELCDALVQKEIARITESAAER